MLHTVEVGSLRGDLIAAMCNMMTWLDTRGSQAAILEQAPGDRTVFRLGFSTEAEALVFICAFGGRLMRPEAGASAA
jgi:hypothetical protein